MKTLLAIALAAAALTIGTATVAPISSTAVAGGGGPEVMFYTMERKIQQDRSRDEPLAGYEDSVWMSVIIGLALAGITIWAGFVVS